MANGISTSATIKINGKWSVSTVRNISLTDAGVEKLRAEWATLPASMRRWIIDQINEAGGRNLPQSFRATKTLHLIIIAKRSDRWSQAA